LLEYTPLNVPDLDLVLNALRARSVIDRSIVDVARELVTKKYSPKFDEWNEFYSETLRAYPEEKALFVSGLRITPSQTLDSKDRIETRIRIFDAPSREPSPQAKVVPLHCFWLLGENSIAISTDEPSIPQKNLRDWGGKLAQSGGVGIANASWGAMIKRFRSRDVDEFAKSLRDDAIANVFDISCRTEEGELSFNATLFRSDGTQQRLDIRKTKTYEKLREELENPNNRRLIALDCYADTRDAFILSFSNLGRDQSRWTFTLNAGEQTGHVDDKRTVRALLEVARLFRQYRFSPPPPFMLNLESYDAAHASH
jgi:hypothetical protein